jgi:hypothetical protein
MMQQVADLCAYVESQNFSKVADIIRDYVKETFGQSPEDDYYQAEISRIRNWLSAFDCVRSVKPLPGILKSNPPRKIVTITFELNGVVIEKNLNLLLGRNLEVLHLD